MNAPHGSMVNVRGGFVDTEVGVQLTCRNVRDKLKEMASEREIEALTKGA